MILLKTCPRCNGDIDATSQGDIYCIQCGHRPRVSPVGPAPVGCIYDEAMLIRKALEVETIEREEEERAIASFWEISRPPCRRCESDDLVRLDRYNIRDNACYRCIDCGYVFSPPAVLEAT